MSKTKFINGQTPIESDFLNKIFGGDPASTNDAERLGHIHDGGTSDGHVAKIDLEDHVTGSVDGSRVKNATLNPSALKSFPDKEDAIQISETSSGSERYFINVDPILEKIVNSTGNSNIIQLSDGSGDFKYVDHAYINNIAGSFGASLDLGNPSDSDYQSRINLYHGELNIFVDGSFKSSFRADTAQTSDINYRLPATIGSANQVLGISSVFGGGSYADLEWITVSGSGGGASSDGARNVVQLSDGVGGFSSGDFKLRTAGSSDYVSINDNDSGISLEMRNKSRVIFENSHSQNLSLSMPDAVCGTSLSVLNSAISSHFFGHNIELPVGNFTPGKAIYVRNFDTSGSTKNIQLGYSAVTFLDTACAYSGYTGTALPSSSTYSGHDSTPMMLVPSELVQFDSTADIAPALAVFSSAGETIFHNGTGISAFSFNAPLVKIEGGLQVGGSGASALKLYDSSNTEYIQISAANTITSSYSITFPSANGSADQILKTDGSGNLSWAVETLGNHTATQSLNMAGNDISDAGDIHLSAGKGIILDSASGLNALASSSIPFDEGYFITAQFQTDLKLGSEAGDEGKIRYDASSNVFEINDGSSWSTIGVTGTTGAPIGAEYLVLSANSSLTSEKVFGVTAGDLVITTSSNSLTLSLNTDVLKSGDNISLLNNDSGFITSAAPISAEYLVLSSDGTLNNEKVFGVTAGDLIITTASNSLTLSLDTDVLKSGDNISLLNNDAGYITTAGAPTDIDYLVLSSSSELSNEKVFGVTAGDLVFATSSNSLTLSLDASVLKTGDNISLLNNDAGYITTAGAPVSAEYLVLSADSALNNEKVFGVTVGDLVLATTSNSLTLSLNTDVLKSGDNISLLNNDAGYVTTSGAPTNAEYLVLSSNGELDNEKVFGVTAGDLVLATSSNSLTLSLDTDVLKSGDNISLLNNDAGYITTAGAPVSAEYLVLSADSALSNEKVFGVTAGDLVLATTSNSLTLSLDTDVLKSGDNISLLNNDAGYVTTSGAPVNAEYLVLSSNSELDNEKTFGVTAGDLVIATSSNSLTLSLDSSVLKTGDNISLLNNDSGYMASLLEDSNPQLGGNLNANGNNIVLGTGNLVFDNANTYLNEEAGYINFYVSGIKEMMMNSTEFRPGFDNGINLGASGQRFANVYAGVVNARNSLQLNDGTYNFALNVPSSMSASYGLTMPDSDGNNGDVLITDGAGNLSFDTAPASRKTTAYLTRADGTVKSGLWTYTASPSSDLTETVYIFNQDLVTGTIADATAGFEIAIEDTTGWSDGFTWNVVNVATTVDVIVVGQNGTGASNLGELNSDNFSLSAGYTTTPGRAAEFTLNKRDGTSYILRLSSI